MFKCLRKNECGECIEYCLCSSALDEHSYHSIHPTESEAVLTRIRSKGKLLHPSHALHELHERLHQLMEAQQQAFVTNEKPLDLIMSGMDSTTTWLPPCHKISTKIIKRLATMKLYMLLKQKTSEAVDICQYDSRSALRATSIK